LINQDDEMKVCGETDNVRDGIELIKAMSPSIAIVDISLKGSSGLELVKELRALNIDVPLLVLSMHEESLYAERALRAGAQGYVMKQEASHNILDAIRAVLKGETVVSPLMKERLLRQVVRGETPRFPMQRLSDRELEVFQLIGQGFATSHIAQKLCLSVKTIETYREKIKQKLGLDNAGELLQQA